jgi:DNA-binding IscR family transcriptional regulator
MRASLREVLENVTLADLASGDLPEAVTKLSDSKDAWKSR